MDQIIIVIQIMMLAVGVGLGLVFCQLIIDGADLRTPISKRDKIMHFIMSGMYMGCAFWCASHIICLGYIDWGFLVLCGLILLATYAIQDRIEFAVYSFLLNGGNISLIFLKTLTMFLDSGWESVAEFLISAVVIYVIIRFIARKLNKSLGAGDYDILFTVFLLCGIKGMVQVMFLSSIVGMIMYVPKLILRKMSIRDQIPLAPVFYLGTLLYCVL